MVLAPSRAIVFNIAELPLEKLPQDIYFNAASFAKIKMCLSGSEYVWFL